MVKYEQQAITVSEKPDDAGDARGKGVGLGCGQTREGSARVFTSTYTREMNMLSLHEWNKEWNGTKNGRCIKLD